MELSTEEQKTQLEVEWVTGPQTQGWGMEAGLGPRGTKNPAFPSSVGKTSSRGKIPGRLGTREKVLWLRDLLFAFFHQALLQNCPRPTEVRDALVWARRGPSGPAARPTVSFSLP